MRLFVAIFCLLIFIGSAKADQEVKVEMPVEKVTVYLSGAQLFHSKTVQLPSGLSTVIVENVSSSIDANSLQAGGSGSFTIMDVQYRLYYPEPSDQSKLPDDIQRKIERVQDSITGLEYEIKLVMATKEAVSVQRNMLLYNKFVTGQGNTDSLELLKGTVAYYQETLESILQKLVKIEREENLLQKEKAAMYQRLYDLQNYWAQQNMQNQVLPIPQVLITIQTEQATSARVDLNYLSYNAGWYASYDIKASDIAQPVRLVYKANIWQTTGVNWKDVLITCSTGNPALGNNPPQLTTWYLTYYNYYYTEKAISIAEIATEDEGRAASSVDSYLGNTAVTPDYAFNSTGVQQTLTNVEFEVNLKFQIPSDGRSRTVALQDKSISSEYNYLAVPKLDSDAFLIARLTGWEDAGLIPGNANIYYKNSLIGRTSLNTLTLNDTLSVSLGRDQAIDIERKSLKDKSSDKFINADRRIERVYEINIRNAKSMGIEIIVMDQIPVAQDASIKVELGDMTKGEYNETTGMITWRDKISSKGKKTYTFGFTVTHPKDKQVQL